MKHLFLFIFTMFLFFGCSLVTQPEVKDTDKLEKTVEIQKPFQKGLFTIYKQGQSYGWTCDLIYYDGTFVDMSIGPIFGAPVFAVRNAIDFGLTLCESYEIIHNLE